MSPAAAKADAARSGALLAGTLAGATFGVLISGWALLAPLLIPAIVLASFCGTYTAASLLHSRNRASFARAGAALLALAGVLLIPTGTPVPMVSAVTGALFAVGYFTVRMSSQR